MERADTRKFIKSVAVIAGMAWALASNQDSNKAQKLLVPFKPIPTPPTETLKNITATPVQPTTLTPQFEPIPTPKTKK